MWYYVYILKNQAGKQYVGHTADLNVRLKEHPSIISKSLEGVVMDRNS